MTDMHYLQNDLGLPKLPKHLVIICVHRSKKCFEEPNESAAK